MRPGSGEYASIDAA